MSSKQPDHVRSLIQQLSLREKVMMLSGEKHFWVGSLDLVRNDSYHKRPFVGARCEWLGIPGVAFLDGPRGIVIEGGATTFPVSMARGATWNPVLEEQVGEAIGQELRALGGNLYGGVCVNLLRHPAWGRAQETFGEDPVHVGAMGAALVRGVERHGMACVKHLAVNSMENARYQLDVTISPRPLHELYLPQFKECMDAGATAVMSAYNSMNGEWCGQNKELLTHLLKERWGFEGFVLTDFIFGLRDAKKAIESGQDLEMPFQMVWAHDLLELVKRGDVEVSLVEAALERLISPQLRLPPKANYPLSVVGCKQHKALAREVAAQSFVLLKNEASLLPLSLNAKIVVTGELAITPNLGDRGSSDGRPDYVVTPFEGLQAAIGERVRYLASPFDEEGQQELQQAEAVLVVVGYTSEDEGEFTSPESPMAFAAQVPPPRSLRWLFANRWLRPLWTRIARAILSLQMRFNFVEKSFGRGGDRDVLGLSAKDHTLIEAVCAQHDRVVVAVMGGSAITMEEWREKPQAIMMLWYPGMEGGHALADVLLGKKSPSGKLPFVIPLEASHLPHFDKDATQIEYDLWHGYRKLDKDRHKAAFPFGFGLSYTTFSYDYLQCSKDAVHPHESITLSLDITNEGAYAGDEVVQLYVRAIDSSVSRPEKELKAFQRVSLAPKETKRVSFVLEMQKLAYFDESKDSFVVEALEYECIVARHADDPKALREKISVIA